MSYSLILGDCLDILPTIADSSIDAVVCDPPYPMVQRPYGRLTEPEWHDLMRKVVTHCRRVLTPTGSALFILQPNYERIGRTRLWLWEFMVWAGTYWNLVEDAYWWNIASLPNAGCDRKHGLMRRSVKTAVWLGPPDCFRDQEQVLWTESQANIAQRLTARAGRHAHPSGNNRDKKTISGVAVERGGVTPYNLLPMPNSDPSSSAGAHGHGAGTPEPLCSWWIRYICPPGGTVLDPFLGSGTTGLAAIKAGRHIVGIEKDPGYVVVAQERLNDCLRAHRDHYG